MCVCFCVRGDMYMCGRGWGGLGPIGCQVRLGRAGDACEWRVIISRAAQSGGAGDRLVGGGWGPSRFCFFNYCVFVFLPCVFIKVAVF